MKTTFLKKSPTQMRKGHRLFAVWLVASCGWMLAGDLTAQSFTTLHSLSCFGNDNDGGPPGTVVLSGNTLYGTTFSSCSQGNGGGTVFAVNTDGTGFRTLYSFTDVSCFPCINSDGAKPWAVCFCQVIASMGPRQGVATRAMALCLPSVLTAQALGICTVSQRSMVITLILKVRTAMERDLMRGSIY